MTRVLLTILIVSSLWGCRKMEIEPIPPSRNEDIFSTKQASVSDDAPINFNLKIEGIYTLTLFDPVSQQVVTRERIFGITGNNTFKLYTKALPTNQVYLLLQDENNNEIGKTLLVIK
jgi:hypothetical protein